MKVKHYLFPLVITKLVDGKNDEVLGQISDFIKITIVDTINKYDFLLVNVWLNLFYNKILKFSTSGVLFEFFINTF